jgi:hypothetical protein
MVMDEGYLLCKGFIRVDVFESIAMAILSIGSSFKELV